MAQRTVVLLEDDLDGGPADETVLFSYDSEGYEIDLSTSNASRLRDVLGPFIEAARGAPAPNSQPKRARRHRFDSHAAVDSHLVRAWAEANGVPVNTRGRISAAVLDQYRTAQV